MAALAGDLSKELLGHSDATKAFRPWWDVVQDGIMYSLVVMGKALIIVCNGYNTHAPYIQSYPSG